MRVKLAVCVILLVAGFVSAQTIPAGYQEYYVVGHEQHVMNFFSIVQAGEGGGCTIPTSMVSVVGLAASTTNQIIYYDHWEDGYEANILAPVQATTLILGDGNAANGDANLFTNDPRITNDTILRGTVLNFNSDQAAGTTENLVVPIPRVATDRRYDGGDRIVSSGGPVTLIHFQRPNGCQFIGSSLEILSRQAVGNAYSYSVPVGTDTYTRLGTAPAGFPFKYVYVDIVAFDDDTDVFIDNKSGGTASLTLQKGEHYSSQGLIGTAAAAAVSILEGTKISTSKPIAGMVYTASAGTYGDRPFALLPDLMHSTDFVVPAPGDDPAVNGSHPLNLYIYNPDSVNTISVTGTDTTGFVTFTIPPNSVKAYTELSAMNRAVPANSAARITSNSNFWGFAAYDHQNTVQDWGHSWLATRFLTSDYSVSWSPGTRDPVGSYASRGTLGCNGVNPCDSLNRSPLFITAIQNNTRVQIDLNNDGNYDLVDTNSDDVPDAAAFPNNTYSLNALQTLRVFDQTDYDNTGTQIVANKNVVVSYGQDTDQGTAVANEPSLDLGHMVYPLDQRWLDSVFTIDKSSNPNFVPLAGGTITYRLTLRTYSFGPLSNITVNDLLPAGASYGGSTLITYPSGATSTAPPTIVGQQLSWALSPNTMQANQTLTIDYAVTFAASGAPRTLRNTARANGTLGIGSIFSPIATADITQTAITVSTTSNPATVGTSQTLTYTTTVFNGGAGAETGVTVTDVIPYPVTFLGSISSSNPAFTGAFSFAQNAVVFSAANFPAGATAVLTFQVTTNADVVGGLVITNTAIYESTQTSNLNASASSVVSAPILGLVKSGPSVAAPGDTLFYSITIRNTGAGAATSFVINDPIPANATYVAESMDYRMNSGPFTPLTDAADADPGTKFASSVRLTLPTSLLAGNSVTFRFRVVANVVTPPAYVNNVASVSSTQSGTDDTNLVQTLIQSPGLITPPPLVNSPIFTTAASISGTSPSPNGTTIRVYRNGVLIGTTTVSGGTWTLSGVSGLNAGDQITADATEAGKTTSNLSPPVVVSAVGQQTPAPFVLGPLYQGDTMIQGTSVSPDGTIINVFVNGVFVGQTTVVGGYWGINGVNPALVAGEVVRATAQEAGKGTSGFSNSVTVQALPLIVKRSSANGGDVIAGQTLTYTVSVTNTTATPWTNLNISDPLPAGTNYVASSSSVTTPVDVVVNDTYRDEFTANNVYNGTNGTLNWTTSWTEVGDDASPTGGGVRIIADLGDNSVRMRNNNDYIYRTANLTGYTGATLTLESRRNSMESGENVTLEISSAGSGGPWTVLQTYLGGTDDAAYVASGNINITAYISANTTIRFLTNNAYGSGGGNDNFYFDNVQVAVSKTLRQTATSAACAPPTLIGAVGCTGYTLNAGETMVVTYKVTLQNPLPSGTTNITNTATFTSAQQSATSGSVTDYVSGIPDVLRNDQTMTLGTYNPASIFVNTYPVRPAMDSFGPDAYPQEGEGGMLGVPGSSDDDDFYKLGIPNSWLDPDATVLNDAARPLVFYEVTCTGCTILLSKDPSGLIKITY